MKIHLISMQGNFRKIDYFQLLHATIFLVFFRPVIKKGHFSILPSLYVKNAMNLTSRRCHCEELYLSDWTSVFSATSRHRESWLSGLCPYYYCSVHLKLIHWGLWQILIIVEKVTISLYVPKILFCSYKQFWNIMLD